MINLLVGQVVALNRVQKLVKSMVGVVIAEASLLKFVLRLYQALATWEHQATAWMLNAPAINVDETSFRVDTKNHWIHVYSSGTLHSSFCTEIGVKPPLTKSTSFRAMGAPSFMTVGRPIYRTMAAITGCVVHTYCANWPSSLTRMAMPGRAT